MGGVSGVGPSSSQQDEELRRIAEQQRSAAVTTTSSTTAPSTSLKIGGFYIPPISAETLANLQAPPVLGDLGAYNAMFLDRAITATRARLANNSGPSRAADELNLRALEQEQAKRATPEPIDIDFLKTDSQVLDALKKETSFLARFQNVVPSEIRLRHEATLNKLEEKHNALYAEAHACDNAKVATAPLPGGANGSYELQFTSDDLVNALKQRIPMTAQEEAAVRKGFESWRSNQCATTGEDPTRIRNEAAMHFEKDTNAAQRAEMQKRVEMLEASTGSACAALAFVDSAMRGDSVDAAYSRVMGARALSDIAMSAVEAKPAAPPVPVAGTGTSAVGRVEPFSSPNGAFRTKPMNKMFETENVRGNTAWRGGKVVEYCRTTVERAPYKLEIRNVTINGKTESRIYGADGKPFDTRLAKTVVGGAGKAIFVMNADGELFASTYQEAGKFHHSSLAGGEPVAAAGEIVVENGKLIEMTNQSGHYLPEANLTNQALASLQNKGVSLSGVKVTDISTGTERVMP